jgi:DNA-binding NtrC family response regulator
LGERARILIVDDDESIRKTLKAILEEVGHEVDTAPNGRQATRKCKTRFYNLALIDIRLPDMEGTTLLTKIGNMTPKMRKIIITGYPSLQNAVEALNRGADAYIVKPFDLTEVLQTIQKQLRRQEEEAKYSQGKVAEFIETRVRELEEEKAIDEKPSRNH